LKLRNQRTVWESTADTRQWGLHVSHCLQNTETSLVFKLKNTVNFRIHITSNFYINAFSMDTFSL
jgi:hypothetical protein